MRRDGCSIINTDTGKPLKSGDVDKSIQDVILKINKVTPTYYSCSGHVSDKKQKMVLYESPYGKRREVIRYAINNPYVVFYPNLCVTEAFKKAGFSINFYKKEKGFHLPERIDAQLQIPRESSSYAARKKIDNAWGAVRKELVKCGGGK